MSKLYSLGLAGFPTDRTTPLPERQFPFTGRFVQLPNTRPEYHLVHTLIPNRWKQSRSFSQHRTQAFSLFCNNGFIIQNSVLGRRTHLFAKIHQSTIATQGRLHYTQCYPNAGSPQAIVPTRPKVFPTHLGLHGGRVLFFHAIGDGPILLNSHYQPPTGRQKPAPGTSSICP